MKPPRNLKKYLAGKLPLPAGFVPLVKINEGILGLHSSGHWFHFYSAPRQNGTVSIPLSVAQTTAMSVAVKALGGTSAKAAKAIGVSPRTVESWRCGRNRLTVEKAYVIARAMADA